MAEAASRSRARSSDSTPPAGRLRIALGGDHEGYRLKEKLLLVLREDRHAVKDHGTHNDETCDYPEIAEVVCRAVRQGEADVGVLVCSSGAGAAMAANKVPGIRAVHCQDTFTARQTRRSLGADVLSLGARVIGDDLAVEIAQAFLATELCEDGRSERLRQRIERLEEQFDDDRQTGKKG